MNDENYNRGQVIFKRDCAACHSIEMDLISTAPALGGITKRRKKEWLYSYTRNSYKMFIEGDSIAKDLRSQNWGLMSGFPKLSNKDLDAIYYFVEKKYEAKKIKN
ncbi:cytochrome c [Flavobacterium sp. MC2016-06]|uniref:c-type cytochrome n=1 Tax=Flavobacterium sp. MC2016-06 TaxID=2676308 RepID=UPI0018ACEF75|nr:cytochrome c [Flavobacterium sp. MC2016-06]MBU3858330.1 cytochrome c [Flavobacterium sp. MC2016-06]